MHKVKAIGRTAMNVPAAASEPALAERETALGQLPQWDLAHLYAKLADPRLAHYRPWLRDTRAFRPHQLSDEIEKLLHEKYVAGRAAWTRLFDETIAELRFPFRGRELTEPEVLDLLSDKDPE